MNKGNMGQKEERRAGEGERKCETRAGESRKQRRVDGSRKESRADNLSTGERGKTFPPDTASSVCVCSGCGSHGDLNTQFFGMSEGDAIFQRHLAQWITEYRSRTFLGC